MVSNFLIILSLISVLGVQWHLFINELGAYFMLSQISMLVPWAVFTDYRERKA
jgi:hypothetical protein